MQIRRSWTPGAAVRVPLFTFAVALGTAVPSSNGSAQSTPPYSIDFHIITAGHQPLRNSCVILSSSLGQTAPGYSSDSTGQFWSVLAGFWVAEPATGRDEIFFDGFEGC